MALYFRSLSRFASLLELRHSCSSRKFMIVNIQFMIVSTVVEEEEEQQQTSCSTRHLIKVRI